MRKSRKWREKRGERRKSPLIMRGPTKWIPIQKENKITKSMDNTYILVQDDEEERNNKRYESNESIRLYYPKHKICQVL